MPKEPNITKQQAIETFDGNQSALARAVGISRQAVFKMKDGPVNDEWAKKIRRHLKRMEMKNENKL